MATFHHELKFLENVQEAASEAIEILNDYRETVRDIERHEDDVRVAQEYLDEGAIGEGYEEDLETSKKYLAESLTELEKLEEKRQRAFDWFYSVSGVNLAE